MSKKRFAVGGACMSEVDALSRNECTADVHVRILFLPEQLTDRLPQQ